MVNILYIGRHEDILQTVVRLINNDQNWFGEGAGTYAEAIAKFNAQDYDIVLLGCGIDAEEEKRLTHYFTERKPSIKIIQHFGGGSGLLKNEILEALNGRSIM